MATKLLLTNTLAVTLPTAAEVERSIDLHATCSLIDPQMKVGNRVSFNQETGQNQSITPVGAFLFDAARASDVNLTPTARSPLDIRFVNEY
jgi:hypothetical protein